MSAGGPGTSENAGQVSMVVASSVQRADFHTGMFQGLVWPHQWLKEMDVGTEREERESLTCGGLNWGARSMSESWQREKWGKRRLSARPVSLRPHQQGILRGEWSGRTGLVRVGNSKTCTKMHT